MLRRLVPHWLREPDLRAAVLGFEEAGRAHGGSGALYVRPAAARRRAGKRGRIDGVDAAVPARAPECRRSPGGRYIMTSKPIDVLGLGNCLVDILAEADDAYLDAQDMVKGAMTLIDEDRAEALYAARVDPTIVSGGSAANTIVGVASFGVCAAYIGKVKHDPLGEAFIADIRATGVAFDTAPAEHGPATGRCFVYVTPDGERTMNTFLGASTYLSPPDVDEELGARGARRLSRRLHVGPAGGEVGLPKAGEIARAAGRRVALTLSDSFCVDRFRGEFIDLMRSRHRRHHVRQHRRDSCRSTRRRISTKRSTRCAREGVLGAVTRSAKGSVVVEGDSTCEVPAFPIARLVDTTGAGDIYAAGFLAGLARGADLTACARLGALAAAEIIQHLGARPEAPLASLARDNGLAV